VTALALAARAATAPLAFLGVLWRFSRPHTLIGTTLSILGIASITGAGDPADLLLTLVAGATVNLFIVGINQVEDVEIDRINKPHLPIAAGEISIGHARLVVAICAVLPVVLGLTQGVYETVAVLIALAVGAAYSCPPLRLKRFPAVAAASISLVRAVVVNLGVALHFTHHVPPAVWALTLFVLPFSFAIAVLKDVPDAEGDRRHRILTFTLRLGPERVLAMGMAALTLGYVAMATLGVLLVPQADPVVMVVGHLGALALAWRWARGVDPRDREAFTAFYMRVWALFFCEYLIVPAAVLSN
jgi:homogentisate phytyltransferase/homogentisate geranylgeranyltransferase